MAKRCLICGRGPQTKISRSHSNVATKRRQYINLQTKQISGKRIKICTKCLKTFKKRENSS
ncbi:MAG: 50S ribosomal protein L28 [Patescibacteria group bacterium]|nr:50S ribosomal protein L28 [Patescibacteria group bacterium]MDD5172620.1 50S ribosomal protein L28 [Patescibacteria group bacterium]